MRQETLFFYTRGLMVYLSIIDDLCPALSYWDLDKMAAILETISLDIFYFS